MRSQFHTTPGCKLLQCPKLGVNQRARGWESMGTTPQLKFDVKLPPRNFKSPSTCLYTQFWLFPDDNSLYVQENLDFGIYFTADRNHLDLGIFLTDLSTKI